MKILVCNVGSTSLKYKLMDSEESYRIAARGGAERIGTDKAVFYYYENGEKVFEDLNPSAYKNAIERMNEKILPLQLDCVAFKVVHAQGITGVQALSDTVLDAMKAFNDVAPAHNPPYLEAISLFRDLLPGIPLIGSFETGFHATIPEKAALYSIPYDISQKYSIRKYGFHGASHEYMANFAEKCLKNANSKIISCHLGGSGSICAIQNGKSIDTSFGISLQCGIPQNNRAGDIDPYIIFHLLNKGYSVEQLDKMLQKESGLLGISGISNDLRDLQDAAEKGNQRAQLAIDIYCYSIRKYIGSYLAVLNGCDAIVFGGGIGEKSSLIRKMVLSDMENLSIELDETKNINAKPGDEISKEGSKTRIFIVETDEERIVAEKAAAYLLSH